MENDKKEAIDDFIGFEEKKKNTSTKEEVLHERSGLIERVDRVFVTSDGKQLLREQY